MEVWYRTRALGSCVLSGPDGWGPDAMEACGSHLKVFAPPSVITSEVATGPSC